MQISKFGKSLVNMLFTSSKNSKAVKGLQEAAPVKKLASKELFCHQYWADATKRGAIRQSNKQRVSLHENLHGINHHFIQSPYPKDMDIKMPGLGMTPREMIRVADFEFKNLKPLEQKMTVYRAIGEKPDFFSEYPLYCKKLGVKKGDIIDMKEYAYATSDISYANVYMPSGKGIMYEIEIPKGARVSRTGTLGVEDEIVFPRSSKFECIDTQKVVEDGNEFLKVKLKYLMPENTLDVVS